MLYCMILYDMKLYHIILYDLMLYYMKLYHIIFKQNISYIKYYILCMI